MSRWPRLRPRTSLNVIGELPYQVAWTGSARSGNPAAGDTTRLSFAGSWGGAQSLGDTRVFWHYNVRQGYIADLASPPKGNTGAEAHASPTPQKFSWRHPCTDILRVAGTDGSTQGQLDEGWGGPANDGWNLWWGGGMYTGFSGGVDQYIPVGIDGRDRDSIGYTQATAEIGYPEAGPGTLQAGYYANNWSDFFTPNTTTSTKPFPTGTLTFRTMQNRTNQCPLYTGPDLGPKIFNKSTGNLTSYDVPGPYPNAPFGSLMFRVNLAYWNTSKRHVPMTVSGGVPASGLGHDSWFVAQPDTPGLRRFAAIWPDAGSYTSNGTNPNNPIAITDAALVSYDVKYIGDEGTPSSAFGRFSYSSGAAVGFDPSAYISSGDKPHTHTWDLVTDAGGYTLSSPDWVSHMTFLVKGDSNSHAHTPFMGQFMGGPTSVTV